MRLFKRKHDPFDDEEDRLHAYLATLDVGSEEFTKAQASLLTVATTREKSWESKRKLDKQGRAGVWMKVIGGIGTLLGIGALGYYEMSGNTFSGEKRKLADGLTDLVVGLFRAGKRG